MKYLNTSGSIPGKEEIVYKIILTVDQIEDIERALRNNESVGGFIVSAAMNALQARVDENKILEQAIPSTSKTVTIYDHTAAEVQNHGC